MSNPWIRSVLAALLCFLPDPALPTSFTVKAGERVQDWCRRLESQGILTCRAVLHLASTASFDTYRAMPSLQADHRLAPQLNRRRNPFEGNRFEGLFLPGDYQLKKLEPLPPNRPEALTSQEIHNAQQVIETLLEATASRDQQTIPFKNLSSRQMWILASIVQKEAVSGRDLDRVAAVFYNRLSRSDRFGSCPTVEYALGYHRPFLLNKDLETAADSPYNLYRHPGLPPTPIAFFSDAALKAVQAPADDDSLYFFVYDWTEGQLHFEPLDGYRDHKRNAARAKANYQSQHGDIRRLFPDRFYE